MRNELRRLWLEHADDPDFAVLTGDLGFMALEEVRERLGPRFINAGIAEQNMISMAAGMASAGWKVWTYTIGPFCYARAFEQIRLSLGFSRWPVRMVGNGGGFSYGVMGPEHHSADDLAILQAVQGLDVYLPAGAEDLPAILATMNRSESPSYLRLSREWNSQVRLPDWMPVRRVLMGERGVWVGEGPLAKAHWQAMSEKPVTERPSLWLIGRLPLCAGDLPPDLLGEIRARELTVLEEHVKHGGLGAQLLTALAEAGVAPKAFHWRGAAKFPAPTSGSREHLWKSLGLWP